MRDLPLFPLQTVLFPGAELPLTIFEERYKLMLRRCLDGDREFGVVLIRSGAEVGEYAEPHSVGTVARITDVQPVDGGRFAITAEGVQRFRIRGTMRDEPYLTGMVEPLEDYDDDAPRIDEAVAQARELFTTYTRMTLAITNQWTRSVALPSRPGALADHIAARVDVEPRTKQHLLEELSSPRRLSIVRRILGHAIEALEGRVQEARRVRWEGFGVMN